MYIVDRRLNPGGKSLANRQRFLRRAKALVRSAVRSDSKDRNIRDIDQGGEISIPVGGLREPQLRRSAVGGLREYVVPGNKEFVEGDEIPNSAAGAIGSNGSPDGEGEDEFRFALSPDEYLDIFLEDLELPELDKRRLMETASPAWRKAGFSVTGSPANLSLTRTLRNSLARRVAMRRPRRNELRALEEEIETVESEGGDRSRLVELRRDLARLTQRIRRIPYLDPLDLRYRQFQPYPKPVAQAVMFCLMDVSGSMTEHMKDLAKRFFALLYIFLRRRYRHVEIVFVRHTHEASEVDEQTFFYSKATGGTVVSTAFQEMARIVAARYPPTDWNVYAAQASDGDNISSDNDTTAVLLKHTILPMCQYFAYLEVAPEEAQAGFIRHQSALWRTYEQLGDASFAMRRVGQRRDIYPVFRELFQRRTGAERPALS